MIKDIFQQIFLDCTHDLDHPQNLEKLCKLYNVDIDKFIHWMQQDPVRYAKWIEFHETVEFDKLVKKNQRKPS